MSTESQDIHQLQLDMVELKGDVKLIRNDLENNEEKVDKQILATEELSKVINQLNLILTQESGRKEGSRFTLKIVWSAVGSLIIAAIIAGSTLLVNMKSQIEVLENELNHIERYPNEHTTD